jgi:mortality factor 4-like protein 1
MPHPIGARVLGLNAGLYYECVVLKTEERAMVKNSPPVLAYFIHYQGWNKKWDTWLSHVNVIENNAAGKMVQKQASKDIQDRREQAIKAAHSRKQKITNRKRKLDTMNEVDEGGEREDFDVDLPIQMALGLKKLLVEDWEKVVQDQKILTLPRSVTVTNILDLFVESKKKKTSSNSSATVHLEVVAGLREYFDRTLGKLLLYRIERVQYNEIVAANPTFSPSEWYGAEHLLRLFVKLPQLLGRLHLDTQIAEALQTRLQEVLKFLQKTPQRFFTAEYFHPDENYMMEYTTGKSKAATKAKK